MRYLYLIHADPNQSPPPAQLMEKLHQLALREKQSKRMVYDGGLMPIAAASKVELRDAKLKVLDGPFAESKEVIGGFAIFELKDHEEALQVAKEFMEMHRLHGEGWQGSCEIRQIFAPPQSS